MIAIRVPEVVAVVGEHQLPPNATVVLARQRRFYSKLVYRAICDIVNYRDATDPRLVEIYTHAYVWMYDGFETEECEDPEVYKQLRCYDEAMSFDTACSMLKWDPSWVREKVKLLTRFDLDHIGRNGLI